MGHIQYIILKGRMGCENNYNSGMGHTDHYKIG